MNITALRDLSMRKRLAPSCDASKIATTGLYLRLSDLQIFHSLLRNGYFSNESDLCLSL
jgi:hypothetical protein